MRSDGVGVSRGRLRFFVGRGLAVDTRLTADFSGTESP